MNSTFHYSSILLVSGLLAAAGSAPGLRAVDAPETVTLDALVAQVVSENPERAFYQAAIAAARGGRRQAGTYSNPELNADVGARRVRAGGLAQEGTAWSVSVMQNFEFPGRMELRKAIANQDVELAELGLAQFEASLAARARTLGFNLLAAQQKAEAAGEVADRLQELLAVLVQREPGGITPLIELRIIEASVAGFRQRAITASQELQSALFDVNRLRGRPLDTPVRIAPVELDLPEAPPLEELLAAARKDSLAIRMRLAELRQQGLEVSLSKNERWPDIAVGPFVSRETGGERETVAGIGIALPLPVWNRNSGNIEIERARQQQAETSLLLTRLEVEQAVMEQHLAYRLNTAELRRWQQDSLSRFHEAAELGDRHYRLGSLPVATYLELQREYLEAVNAILELQANALAAREQLELLTRVSFRPAADAADESAP